MRSRTASLAAAAPSTTDSFAAAALSLTDAATFLLVRLATRFGLTRSAIASSVPAKSSRVFSISAANAAGSAVEDVADR